MSLVKNTLRSPIDNGLQGYKPLYGEWDKEIDYINNDGTPQVYSLKEDYFNKLLDVYTKAGINVVVFVSPDYELYSKPLVWKDKIASICKKYSVQFIDHSHDTLFMEHREWFNEPFHLNDTGAKVYTSLVCNEILGFMNTEDK